MECKIFREQVELEEDSIYSVYSTSQSGIAGKAGIAGIVVINLGRIPIETFREEEYLE